MLPELLGRQLDLLTNPVVVKMLCAEAMAEAVPDGLRRRRAERDRAAWEKRRVALASTPLAVPDLKRPQSKVRVACRSCFPRHRRSRGPSARPEP